jgi:Uma2 family endonuclease
LRPPDAGDKTHAIMVIAAHTPSRARSTPRRQPLPLMNGDHLTSAEFLRRYEAMPDLKKAELIDGTVYMPPPVSADSHAEPDNVLQFWLRSYALHHPELKCYSNATLLLDADNTPQPDSILCSAPHKGGRVWLNEHRWLCGAPELVCEIAASSASIDLHRKLHAYRRAGIQEYLVWTTLEKRVRWFQLVEGEYLELKERAGRIGSIVFPGLVLDVKALLKLDCLQLVAALTKKRR